MSTVSRTQKSLLNARVNLICYVVSLSIAFFTRKIFLDELGAEFMGLTGTLQSLLGFLNIAEMGVGLAIGYVLYQPIFDENREKISEIISVLGYLYQRIGLFILAGGIALSAFLPLIFPDTPFSWSVIYCGFYAFLFSSLLTYFVNYRMVLLSADQRNYEVMGYYQICISTKVLLQMFLALYFKSLLLYFTLEIVLGCVYSVILHLRVRKIYPWLVNGSRKGRTLLRSHPEVERYIKQIFVHKIGDLAQFQMMPMLIYACASLPIVAVYANYTLLTTKLQGVVSAALDGTSAGIGNLVAEGKSERVYAVFEEIFAVRAFVAGVISICTFFLISPFITLWIGREYVLSNIVVFIIVMQMFLVMLRGTVDSFLYAHGLFYDIWAAIAEPILLLIISLVGGEWLGLPGVLAGPLLSTIAIIYIWRPYFLYSKGFNVSVVKFIYIICSHVAILASASLLARYATCYFIPYVNWYVSWGQWVLGGFLLMLFSGISAACLMILFSRGFRMFVRRFIKFKQ